MLTRIAATLALVLSASIAAAQPASFGTIRVNGDQVCAPASMGIASMSVQVTGTWSGTITFQGTSDGSTYVSLLTGTVTSATTQTTTTANGVFTISNPGLARVCATATAWTSGVANLVIVNGGAAGGAGGGGGGGAVTQGTVPWVVSADGGTFAVTQSGVWASRTQDGAGNAITSAAAGATRPLDTAFVNPDGTRPVLANDPCGQTTKTSLAINNGGASGNFELVALSGATVIYVCSVDITAEATVDARLVYGTGTACATGETGLTGLYAFSTTTGLLGINKGDGGYYVYKGAAGNAVCLETSGAVQVNGSITYVQQ